MSSINKGDAKEIIEFGINTLDSPKMISIPVQEFALIYKTIEEVRRFIHNPEHYSKPETVKKYIGDKESGLYSIIDKIYFDVFESITPDVLIEKLESEELNSPKYPYYY